MRIIVLFSVIVCLFSCVKTDNCKSTSNEIFKNIEIIYKNPDVVNSELLNKQDSLIDLISYDCKYLTYIIDIKYSLGIMYKRYDQSISYLSAVPDTCFSRKFDKRLRIDILYLNKLFDSNEMDKLILVRESLISYLEPYRMGQDSLFISSTIEGVNAITLSPQEINKRIHYIENNKHLFFGENFLVFTTILSKIRKEKLRVINKNNPQKPIIKVKEGLDNEYIKN